MIVLHVFTEEPSAKNVFQAILPRILPPSVHFRIYDHQGKQDLEHALKSAIPSISKIPGSRVLVTRDQDNDCKELKKALVAILDKKCSCPYFVRIICQELESWFLGDMVAVQKAYARFKAESYINRAEFRNVDSLQKPHQQILEIIPEYSGRTSLPKLETSEKIAEFLEVQRNTSKSFHHTIDCIKRLISATTE